MTPPHMPPPDTPASSTPARSGDRRRADPWNWALAIIALLFCGTVAGILYTHEAGDRREVGVVREFRLARVNIARAYLHISLGGPGDSPWQREQGLRLLEQGVLGLQNAARRMNIDATNVGQLRTLADRVVAAVQNMPTSSRADSGAEIEVRAALHAMENVAGQLDVEIRERFDAERARQATIFSWLVSGAAALLVALAAGYLIARRRQNAADRSLAITARLLERAQDAGRVGSFVIDTEGNFSFSKVACDILGRPAGWAPSTEEFLSTVAEADRDRVGGILRRVSQAGGRRETEYRIVRASDGEERWVSVIADSDVDAEGRPLRRIGTFLDVTERKRSEKRVAHSTQLYAALSRTNDAMLHERRWEALCERICRIVVEYGGLDGAGIRMHRPESRSLDLIARHVAVTGWTDVGSLPADDPHGLVARAFRHNEVQVLQELAEQENLTGPQSRILELGLHAQAALPISHQGQVLGVLTLFAIEAGFFDDERIALLREIADNLAYAHARQEMADSLAASERRFRALVEESITGTYIVRRMRVAYVNRRCAEILGRAPEDLLGKRVLDLVRLAGSDNAAAPLPVASGRVYFSSIRPDGTEAFFATVYTEIELDGRKAFIGTIDDLTGARTTERALAETARDLELAQEAARIGSFVVGTDGRGIFSRVACDILGLPHGSSFGEPDYLALVAPRDHERVREAFERALRFGERSEVEYRIVRPSDGAKRWIRATGDSERDTQGRPLRRLGTIQDITEHKETEQRIERLTRMYAALSHTNDAIIHAADWDGLCSSVCRIIVEQGRLKRVGIRMPAADGESLRLVAAYGEAEARYSDSSLAVAEAESLRARVFRESRPIVENAWAGYQPASDRATHSAAGFPLIVDGNTIGVIAMMADETGFFDDELVDLLREIADNLAFAHQRIALTRSLAQTQDHYRALFEASPDAIRVICEDRVALVNPAEIRMLGIRSADEVLGRFALETVAADDMERVRAAHRRVLENGETVRGLELRLHRPDGGSVPVDVTLLPFSFDGKPAILRIGHDLSERHKSQARIARLADLREALTRTNLAVARATSWQVLCESVCTIIVEHAHVEVAVARMREGDLLRPVASFGEVAGRIGTTPVPLSETANPVVRAFASGEPCLVPDMLAEPGFATSHAAVRELGLSSAISLPVKDETSGIGTLSVLARDPGHFDGELIALLTEIADSLAFAHRKLTAEASLRESEERFRALTSMASDWYWETDEQHRFTTVSTRPVDDEIGIPAETLIGRTRWDSALAEMTDEEIRQHRATLDRHEPFRDFEARRRTAAGELRVALISGEPMFDAAGRFTGYRGVGRSISAQRAAEERIAHLARLKEALSRTNAAVAHAPSWQRLCEEVCRVLVDQGGLVATGIRTPDETGTRLMPFASHGAALGTSIGPAVALNDSTRPAVNAFHEGRAIIYNDTPASHPAPQALATAQAAGIRSFMFLPLRQGDRRIGVLTIYSDRPGHFDAERVELISQIGEALAYAHAKFSGDAARAASEAQYRSLFDASPDAIRVICDGKVVLANPAAVFLFGGGDMGRVVGANVMDTIAPDFRAKATERFRKVLATGEAMRTDDACVLRADGSRAWAELVLQAHVHEGRPATMAVIRDISARRETQLRLRRLADLKEALSRTNEAILHQRGWRPLCDEVCRIAVEKGGLLSARIREFDPAAGTLTQIANCGEFESRLGVVITLEANGDAPPAIVVRDGKPLILNDMSTAQVDLAATANVLAQGIHSTATFPIRAGQEIVGTLGVFARDPGYFDDELVGVLAEMASNLGFALAKRRAESALAESGERLAGIIASATDAIITVGEDLRVLVFNQAAVAMFGITAEEALESPMSRFIPPRFHGAHESHIRAFGASGETRRSMGRPGQVTALRANGEEFPVEASISKLDASGRRVFTVIMRDVTERQRAERRIQRLALLYQALSRTNEAMLHASDWTALCEDVCRIVVYEGRFASAAIRLHDPARETLDVVASHGVMGGRIGVDSLPLASTSNAVARAFSTGAPVVSNVLPDNIGPATHIADPRKLGILSSAVFPLQHDGSVLGTLGVFAGEAAYFDDELTALLKDIADNLAFAHSKLHTTDALMASEARFRDLARQLEQRVDERTAALQAANRDMEAFSYSVAHDLRAPLRSMAGFAQLLQLDVEDGNTAKLNDHVARIVANAGRMNDLIDGLLQVARASHNRIEPVRVEMRAMVGEVVEELKAGERAAVSVAPMPAMNVDPSSMRQVWTNLISNALKYSSRRDSPVIDIACANAAGEVTFSVADNGAGFAPEYAGRLFGVFQRLHSANEFEGTGIGLAIVRRIVERHGGRVWAEGRPGQGATFSFTLPADRLAQPADSPRAPGPT